MRNEKTKIVVEKTSWQEKDWISISVLNNYKGNWIRRKAMLFLPNDFEQIKQFENIA